MGTEAVACIILAMPRSSLRVFFIVVLILLVISIPFFASGYGELRKAAAAGDHAEAALHYQNAAQRLPWRADLYEMSGHHYYYAKEYERADAAYQKALEHKALSAEGWVAWGDVLYLNGDLKRAQEIWEQAAEQSDPSSQLYSRLAEIYQSNGELTRAAEILQQYVSANPDDASAHYRLGLLLTLSNLREADAELATAAQLDPKFAPAVATLHAALDLALQNDSTSGRFVIVGRGLGLVNEWKLARAAFESAVEADDKNAEAWAWLGEANQQTGVPAGGSAELDLALALNPNLATVRGLRGLYFQRAGNFREALAEFEMAAALEPENPAWFVSVGESQSKNGDLIRALQAYQTATMLAPEDASYWRLLAIFCAQNNVYVRDVGVPAAQKAVVLGPEDPASLDVLGWLLTLDARYEEAARMLNRALELDSGNASAHLHFGMLYMETNERALAYDHLVQARDLGNQEAEIVLKQYFP